MIFIAIIIDHLSECNKSYHCPAHYCIHCFIICCTNSSSHFSLWKALHLICAHFVCFTKLILCPGQILVEYSLTEEFHSMFLYNSGSSSRWQTHEGLLLEEACLSYLLGFDSYLLQARHLWIHLQLTSLIVLDISSRRPRY